MKYPKIHSLYKRKFTETDPITGEVSYIDKGKSGNPLIVGDYACREFESIKYWSVTEKVDGTNIRIIFQRNKSQDCKGNDLFDASSVYIGGRTDNAQIPADLYAYLSATFTRERMGAVFKDSNYVVLFGEGYGPKIQSGGYYRKDVAFILFDVYCGGWWLDRAGIHDVARDLEIDYVPMLMYDYRKQAHHVESSTFIWTIDEIWDYMKNKPKSWLAEVQEHEMEGIVARSEPQMLFRDGKPIMFKLKCRDLV